MIEIKIVVFLCLKYFYYIIVKKFKKKKKGVFDIDIIFNRGDLYILMN